MAAAFGLWVGLGSHAPTLAGDPTAVPPPPGGAPAPGYGTLGYGGPGVYPGFQGFGLGYHLGNGYGGGGLGVGAFGGYPGYGGPGYPHGTPPLNRFGRIVPFTYYGGPGGPSPGHPNYFGLVGPLAVEPPVAFENNGSTQGYGPATGAIPYPDTLFAPYASTEGVTGLPPDSNPAEPPRTDVPETRSGYSVVSDVRTAGGRPAPRPQARDLGIQEEPVVDTGGVQGLKIVKVDAGSVAEKAGLEVGDVIHSANGHLTRRRGNLAWIAANAAPDHPLKIRFRKRSDGREHATAIQLP